ncbi:MAG: bifunctional aspartate kinase/homoserine dehydrogenase I, partial [Persicimonas sp.]
VRRILEMLEQLELVRREQKTGPMAIVCSAMGETTEWLLEAVDTAAGGDLEAAEAIVDRIEALAAGLARDAMRKTAADELPALEDEIAETLAPLRKLLLGVSLLREKTPQTLDLILSFGERSSARLVAKLLEATGTPALFQDSRAWTVTDDTFGDARVDFEASKARLEALRDEWGERVPVHTGFLGETPDGRTTTLGRNGSDYTATLLAAMLEAEEVVVSTDVAGVMTADPLIVEDAYPLERLSYLEALELANYGTRMFHDRTMLPLIESGIPMRIRSTMDPEEPGTRIDAQGIGEGDQPTCVTSLENLALIDVRWRELAQQAQMGRRVLRALESEGVTVWMATQAAHGQAVAVAVPVDQVERARGAIRQELRLEFDRHEVEPLDIDYPVTLLTLVAEKIRESQNIAGAFFQALGAVGVDVLAIGQGKSSRSISCVIPADDTKVAVRTVHAGFNFAHQEVNLLVLGQGVVGSALLAQICAQQDKLESDHDVSVRVAGLANSKRLLFDETGVDLDRWSEALDARPDCEPNSFEGLCGALDRLSRMSVPVLVDVTASDDMQRLYAEAFERGIHVVAANKKPLTGPVDQYQALCEAARREHRAFHYETTVGASLPVVDTLQNLVRTGDRVLLIEGAFSGTLGYLTNEVMAGVPLSKAVRTAKKRGYTEPRPQDDLSGLDVARKALILARELGMDLELADVEVEPLVPQKIIETEALEAFFAALEDHDDAFMESVEQWRANDQMLRYLAVIDPGVDEEQTPQLRVGPVGVEADHPAAHLRGSEGFVAFTTERYSDYPLIVQGAGAGGAVTAAGVLSDVLRISQNLRGR